MAQVNLKKSYGPQGPSKVTLGNKIVRIQMNGEVYELEKDAWDVMYSAGEYDILLSKDLTKIVSLRPPSPGTHIVKFFNFGNRINEIPEPKIQRGGPRKSPNGGTYIANDKLVFTANLEIVEGSQYDGLRLSDIQTYGFEPVPGSGETMITMDGKRDLERFETFMRAQGINLADLVIPFSPNILPWLEKYLQENAKPFMVTTNDKGFIDTRSTIPAHLLPKDKKPAKKVSKKK